jgi:hypothetical protein
VTVPAIDTEAPDVMLVAELDRLFAGHLEAIVVCGSVELGHRPAYTHKS